MRLVIFSIVLFTGCHNNRIQVGAPIVQRVAPDVTCVVIVQGKDVNKKLAEEAVDACWNAIGKNKP